LFYNIVNNYYTLTSPCTNDNFVLSQVNSCFIVLKGNFIFKYLL